MLVAIVGLPAKYLAALQRARPDLTFRMVDKEGRSFIPEADHVFVLTRFVGHRWTDYAFRTFPRDRIHLVPGSLSGLRTRIDNVVSRSCLREIFT